MVLTGKKLEVAQLLLVVMPAFVLFGYNQSGVGGLLSLRDFAETFPEMDTVTTTGAVKTHKKTIQGTVVAMFTIGALLGALSCSKLGDMLGRRKLIFVAACLTLIGEILQCSSFHIAQFIVGRFILGWGVGQLSATVPVWQSECSGSKNRGAHTVLDGCFISLGYVLESWINLGFFEVNFLPVQWRIPLVFPIFISIVLIATVFLIPESPRWLCRMGRGEQARASLAKFRGLSEDDPLISAEIGGIELALEETGHTAASIKDIFTMGKDKLFYRFMLCMLLQMLQQMCGSNLISVYATILFQDSLGMSPELSRVLTGACLTWKFLSCFVAFFTIDRFGRRALFIFSGFGMSSCMLALAVSTSFSDENTGAMGAAAFFIFAFNFFVPIGFLGANFLYCTEVAPIKLRVPMASFSTANHWLWNFVVVMVSMQFETVGLSAQMLTSILQITPVAVNTIGYQYFIVYAVISACIVPLVYFFYPETMGRSLEELEMLFSESPSIMSIVKESKRKPTQGGLVSAHLREKLGNDDDEVEYKA
jgi:sugar porter (SP) family MFS transporter